VATVADPGTEVTAFCEKRVDRHNEEIAGSIQKSGLALLMTTRIRGRVALRMSICARRVVEADPPLIRRGSTADSEPRARGPLAPNR